MYDIIIIGGGPAGLTAAVYACRADKSVLVIEKETAGGQITFSPQVENIPGFVSLSGSEFAEKLVDQAMSQGAEIEFGEVIKIRDLGETKEVVSDMGTYEAKAVIIATGAKHRMLGLPKETDFVGNGISFCAVCDGAFYRDRRVGVVGGGNSALQEALLLSDLASEVVIFQDLPVLTGEKKLQEKLAKKSNVSVITGVRVAELLGEEELSGVRIEHRESGISEEHELDGLFVAIGLVPQNENFVNVVTLNSYGYVEADENMKSGVPGIFTAGDCRSKRIRQVTTAVSDGAIAALSAVDFIEGRG